VRNKSSGKKLRRVRCVELRVQERGNSQKGNWREGGHQGED